MQELELELMLELELYPDSSLKEQSVFIQIPLNVLSPHAHLLILFNFIYLHDILNNEKLN